MHQLRIAINSYISNRGISGSAVAVGKIHESLIRLGHEVITITPSRHFRSRMLNLVYLVLWDTYICSRKAIHAEAEILIHTCNTGLQTPKIRSVLVMHDTMVLDYKGDFDAGYRIYAKIMFWLSAKSAHSIMTPSEYSKKSIQKHWPNKNVIVNYWPVKKNSGGHNKGINGHIRILWNAAMEKHKQPLLMLQVARELNRRLGSLLTLTLVTRSGNASQEFNSELERIPDWENWITIESGLTESQLSHIYEFSDILLVTSKAEGFCLPALEAMSYSVPVVHNNIATLIEVCGNSFEGENTIDSMVNACMSYYSQSAEYFHAQEHALSRALFFSEDLFDEKLSRILKNVMFDELIQ